MPTKRCAYDCHYEDYRASFC